MGSTTEIALRAFNYDQNGTSHWIGQKPPTRNIYNCHAYASPTQKISSYTAPLTVKSHYRRAKKTLLKKGIMMYNPSR
ncbi:hypothetical protein PISMIDRAFT_430735 [Pisolithus microcarpus 441]|uniref:Uncharacterized protein n=1 Tax=Pisolithus microcarpus 441 TaxID=765257 RepID=A0A0C9ZVZ4_9AGAM|nr:hypothetical protein PISMIDRAFT_430735 [Pisolithus microcarpus 441]